MDSSFRYGLKGTLIQKEVRPRSALYRPGHSPTSVPLYVYVRHRTALLIKLAEICGSSAQTVPAGKEVWPSASGQRAE